MNTTAIKPDQVIATLNHLIELNRDGQNGFQEAAAKIEAPTIKAFCLDQSLSRAKFVGELQTEVRSMGVEPDTTGSVAGALHRGWMDLKSALGGGDAAILAATETGEDHAVSEYVMALTEPLPAPARAMVEDQLQSINLACAKVKALRASVDQ